MQDIKNISYLDEGEFFKERGHIGELSLSQLLHGANVTRRLSPGNKLSVTKIQFVKLVFQFARHSKFSQRTPLQSIPIHSSQISIEMKLSFIIRFKG